jgi:hypothetical protein
VSNVTKARLFSLLILAVFVAMFAAKLAFLHPGGFNEGGFW